MGDVVCSEVASVSDVELKAAEASLASSPQSRAGDGEESEAPAGGLLLLQCALTRQEKRLERIKGEFGVDIDRGASQVLKLNGTTTRKEVLGEIQRIFEGEDDQVRRDKLARFGLELWSRAYNQMLAWKDDLHLLTFDESVGWVEPGDGKQAADPSEADEHRKMAQSFGLVEPPLKMRHRLRALWRKDGTVFKERDEGYGDGSLRVDGTTLRDAELLTPSATRQIRSSERSAVISGNPADRGATMRDLALHIQDMAYQPEPHAIRRKKTWRRALVLGAVALILFVTAVLEIRYDPGSSFGFCVVVGAALLSLASSLPWGDAHDLWRLQPRQLSGALDIREDPQAGGSAQ